jgi:type IV pilus assembly protein PilA
MSAKLDTLLDGQSRSISMGSASRSLAPCRPTGTVHGRRGFTLIELLIVIVIIGILAAVAIPKFGTTKQRANRSAGIADLRNLSTVQEAFYADSDRYGALADTGTMRFSLSKGTTALSITLAGTPTGSSGWSATVSVPGPSSCGVFVGSAPAPAGMPAGTTDGVPVCW